MQLEDIKEGQEYRLTTRIGAVGYAHSDEIVYREFVDGDIVTVSKVVKNLIDPSGSEWNRTVIVSRFFEVTDEDGCDVEVSFSGFVSANYLEEV